MLALSSDSISCSKLSNAVSLESRGVSGERRMVMADFMRSASDGPPKRDWRAVGLRGRDEESEVVDGVVELVLFSMDHLRRLES